MDYLEYQVHPKERLYFGIRLVVSILLYLLLTVGTMSMFIFYMAIFALYILFNHGILIGYLKGNAIRINQNQFPEIFALVEECSRKLGLEKTPTVYLVQAGGLLNAYATRFLGRNYVVLYSDILETAFEEGNKAIEFIIAHELGHIKRKHMTKNLLLFPSAFIPFLANAYSRACEYTCDQIGLAFSPAGAISGLLVLAAGKRLHKKVNTYEYLLSASEERGFWQWLAEVLSTHPNLPKRIQQLTTAPFQTVADSYAQPLGG